MRRASICGMLKPEMSGGSGPVETYDVTSFGDGTHVFPITFIWGSSIHAAEGWWRTGLAHVEHHGVTEVATFTMNRREFPNKGLQLGVNPHGLVEWSFPVLRIDPPRGNSARRLFWGRISDSGCGWP